MINYYYIEYDRENTSFTQLKFVGQILEQVNPDYVFVSQYRHKGLTNSVRYRIIPIERVTTFDLFADSAAYEENVKHLYF